MGSATTLKRAMQMVKKWVVKNEYLQAGEIDVCRKFYDYNKNILIDPAFVRNSDYCMIVAKNDPEDTNLTYID